MAQLAAPGFTAVGTPPPVVEAGWWDWLTGGSQPSGDTCTHTTTDTKCIIVTEWCKDNYICGRDPKTGNFITKDSGWYICGACFGFDW